MKKLTFLTSLLIVLISCTTEEMDMIEQEFTAVEQETKPLEAQPETQLKIPSDSVAIEVEVLESKALRTTLEVFKDDPDFKMNAQTKENQNSSLCFQFVYPLVVAYNDGSEKQLKDYDALLGALLDESTERHITGVGFPFEIYKDGSNQVYEINDEEEFKMLIADCGYDEVSYTDVIHVTSPCFTVNYPLELIISDKVKAFESQEEADTYFNTFWSSSTTVTISYPFRVTLHTADGDERTSIENDFEMINLVKTICGIE
ncbi:hypothetical protein [Flavimarina sp. Hel_I_48]|uniref:hypothetical protein n=1 Tax=Flavimarina sp. Hel_I_48 TaxID=1392488 RepID=UPI0004DEF6B5|nr:hypothetical protein [Flavimarina sp. Hel_I_48]